MSQVAHGAKRSNVQEEGSQVLEAAKGASPVTQGCTAGPFSSLPVANAPVEPDTKHGIQTMQHVYATAKHSVKSACHEIIQQGAIQRVKHVTKDTHLGPIYRIKVSGNANVAALSKDTGHATGCDTEAVESVGKGAKASAGGRPTAVDDLEVGENGEQHVDKAVKEGWNGLINTIFKGLSNMGHVIHNTTKTSITTSVPAPIPRVQPTPIPKRQTTAGTMHLPHSTAQQVTRPYGYAHHHVPAMETASDNMPSEDMVISAIAPPMVVYREAILHVPVQTLPAQALPAINTQGSVTLPTAVASDGSAIPTSSTEMPMSQQPIMGELPALYLLMFMVVYFILTWYLAGYGLPKPIQAHFAYVRFI